MSCCCAQPCLSLHQSQHSQSITASLACATADGSEHLKPEMTANPALHRFFAFMAVRALDPDAQLPAHDLQVQHTLSCPFGHKDQAQAALNQLSELFSVQQQVCQRVALLELIMTARRCKHQ